MAHAGEVIRVLGERPPALMPATSAGLPSDTVTEWHTLGLSQPAFPLGDLRSWASRSTHINSKKAESCSAPERDDHVTVRSPREHTGILNLPRLAGMFA